MRPTHEAPSPPNESLSRVAVLRANQEARRVYNVEPFTRDQGTLRRDGNAWIWQALTSSGQADLVAQVNFSPNGSVAGVNVQMMSHPSPTPAEPQLPVPNEDALPSPGKQPLGPPEIFPK